MCFCSNRPCEIPAKFEVRNFTHSWDNSAYLKNFVQSLGTPFKVIQGHWFWYQWKARIWLPISPWSYLAPFRRYYRFLCSWPHPYSTPILGVFPLHQIAHFGVSQSRGLIKLFGRGIIFEEFQPMWSRYLNVTDGQTDGQTIYDRNTALCTKVHRAVNS